MPDENRFAGIGDAVGDDGDADGTDVADEPDDEVEGDDGPSTPADGASDEQSTDDAPTTAEASTPDDTAAFEFDDTVQKSVYVRPETFETLEDAEALVDAQLRTDHEVKDLTRREFFDAVFAEAADDTDRLVERILQMRER
jgi:hypothetical protein